MLWGQSVTAASVTLMHGAAGPADSLGVEGKGGLKDEPSVFDLNSWVLEKLSMDFTHSPRNPLRPPPPGPRTKTTLISEHGWVFMEILGRAPGSLSCSSCIPWSRLQPWHVSPAPHPCSSLSLRSPFELNFQLLAQSCSAWNCPLPIHSTASIY